MIVGANPQRGGKQVAKKHKKKAYKRNEPGKKKHGKKRAYKARARHNEPGRKHTRKHYRKNPVHGRKKKHYRRNPAAVGAMGLNWTKPMTYLPFVANAAVASIATVAAPRMLGFNTPLKKYGVQAAIAVGGGFLVKSVLGKTHGFVFGITSLAVIAGDLLNTYVLSHLGVSSMMGLGDGMGAYESSMLGTATPYVLPAEYMSGMDAYEQPSFGLSDSDYKR